MDPSPIELLSTLETKSGPGIRDEFIFSKIREIEKLHYVLILQWDLQDTLQPKNQ